MPSVLELALLSEAVYDPAAEEVAVGGAVWHRVGPLVDDPSTGFQAAVFCNRACETVVAYRGTNKDDATDWRMNAVHETAVLTGGVGTDAGQLGAASRLVEEQLGRVSPGSLTLTGHSLGGFLAATQARRHGLRAVVFNAHVGGAALTALAIVIVLSRGRAAVKMTLREAAATTAEACRSTLTGAVYHVRIQGDLVSLPASGAAGTSTFAARSAPAYDPIARHDIAEVIASIRGVRDCDAPLRWH